MPLNTYLHNPNRTLTLVTEEEGRRRRRRVGRYCLIICADTAYMRHSSSSGHLDLYRDYAREFNVTFIRLLSPFETSETDRFDKLSLASVGGADVRGLRLNPSKEFYYLKSGEWMEGNFTNNSRWMAFKYVDSAQYKQLEVFALIRYQSGSHDVTTPLVLSYIESGVRSVLVGSPIMFWLTRVLLLELVRAYSLYPLERYGRERWIMVDIDDIFVAPLGLKMSEEDVQVRAE